MKLWNYLRDFEPAQLNAIKVAVLGLLATLATDVEANVSAVVATAIVVLTEAQALLTRFGVFAPATVEKLLEPTQVPFAAGSDVE
jgi:hypothetical protein